MKRRLFVWMLALIAVFTLSACGEEEAPVKDYDITVTSEVDEFEYDLEIEGNTMTLSLDSYNEETYAFVHWYEPETFTVLSEEESFERDLYKDSMTIEAVFEFTGGGGEPGEFTGDESFDTLISYELDSYYQQAEGLYGSDLDDALTTILNRDITNLSYGDIWDVVQDSDEDPDNPGNVILVYTRESVSGPATYPTYNREHVWPQSKFDVDAKSDAHHLKPSDVDENSRRGNLPFGESGSTYEPPDEVKGDVARMLFYMDARYDSLNVESGIVGDLGMLLRWHVEDPVDDFERNRNDVIYDYQGNRNPFIDHPHLAYLMFYDHPSLDLD